MSIYRTAVETPLLRLSRYESKGVAFGEYFQDSSWPSLHQALAFLWGFLLLYVGLLVEWRIGYLGQRLIDRYLH